MIAFLVHSVSIRTLHYLETPAYIDHLLARTDLKMAFIIEKRKVVSFLTVAGI